MINKSQFIVLRYFLLIVRQSYSEIRNQNCKNDKSCSTILISYLEIFTKNCFLLFFSFFLRVQRSKFRSHLRGARSHL